MATLVTIARTTRLRLRLDRTSIATVAEGGTSVDVEDPAIKRDMNRTVGRWVVLTDAVDDGQATSLVYNETGGTLAAGSLVYFSGYDEATGKRNIVLADADGATGIRAADGVLRAALDDATEGQVFSDHRIAAVNTNGLAVGDPIYLSTTAGGWTATKPTGADDLVQVVGHVAVVHAAAGVVEINLDKVPDKIGTDQLQDDAVTEAKVAGLTATFTEVNELAAKAIGTATFGTLSAEAAEARQQSIQLKDGNGADLAVRGVVGVYVSTDANGDTPGDGGATITLTAGTDGALLGGGSTGVIAWFVSEADGDLDVVLTDGAAATQNVYLNVITPLGEVITSGVIAFAA